MFDYLKSAVPVGIAAVILICGVIQNGYSDAADNPDRAQEAFGLIDPRIETELGEWLQHYIENRIGEEFHIRSRFATVNPAQLNEAAKTSLAYREHLERDQRGRVVFPQEINASATDILFEMYPGETYRVAATSYRVGSSRLIATVRGLLVGTSFTGRERVKFEIGLDGRVISVLLVTKERMYHAIPTPEPDVVVITELDQLAVGKSIRLD